jgi:hypothetical protein
MERMSPWEKKITTTEAAALKSDIVAGGMTDNTEAAEKITTFLTGRGYAVDHESMLDLIRSANQESLEEFRRKLEKSAIEN